MTRRLEDGNESIGRGGGRNGEFCTIFFSFFVELGIGGLKEKI